MTQSTSTGPHLSLIIPCFNEEERIQSTLVTIGDFLRESAIDAEVLVIDDGSSDGTQAAAEAVADRVPGLRIIRNQTNSGKGFAVRHGVQEAQGVNLLFSDADLSTPIEETSKLLALLDAGADVAIGSRRMASSQIEIPQPFFRRFIGATFVLLQQLLTGMSYKDTQCGFKAFRTDVARQLFGRSLIRGFCFDVEILVMAVSAGYRVEEVPIRWRDDRNSRINPLVDATRMFADLLAIRWHMITGKYSGIEYLPRD